MKLFLIILSLLLITQAEGQDSLCFKQIDSLVERILEVKPVTQHFKEIGELNGTFKEIIIQDTQTFEILAILQDYFHHLYTEDTSARSFHVGLFFYKGELINVKEFEMNSHLRKINEQNFYYVKSDCSDFVQSNLDLTKKVYYYRLASRLKEFYSKREK